MDVGEKVRAGLAPDGGGEPGFEERRPAEDRGEELSPNHPARGLLSAEELEESGYDGPMAVACDGSATCQADRHLEGCFASQVVTMPVDDARTASAPASGRWEFDATVTAAFDDMLERSIPNYSEMRRITTDAALWLVDRTSMGGRVGGSVVYDIGASRGAALQPIVDSLGVRGQYVAAEISPPMLEALEARFAGMIEAGVVEVREHDLRDGFPEGRAPSVILSVLTLQFVPIEYRQRLLREAYERLRSGGGLILVEKVLGEAEESNALLVDLYYGLKREHGYTQEAIDRKRMSLEGVLVPLTASINEGWLRAAGFDLVECIWSWCNFRAWVAVKR